MIPTRPRPQRPTLPPADEARLAAATAELSASIAQAEQCTAEVTRVTDDLDSDRLSMDGIVLEPADDDDSVVIHVREALRGLGSAA